MRFPPLVLLAVILLVAAGCEQSPAERAGVRSASVSAAANDQPGASDAPDGSLLSPLSEGASPPAEGPRMKSQGSPAAPGAPDAEAAATDEAEYDRAGPGGGVSGASDEASAGDDERNEAQAGDESEDGDLAGPDLPPSAVGSPTIKFDTTIYDFGSVTETHSHQGTFSFTNTGDATLVIEAIKPTCGCTAVDLPKREYAPGERGTLKFNFDPTAPGAQRKYIDVLSNDGERPMVRLTIAADVQAFIVVRPRSLELGIIPYGQEHRAMLRVTCGDGDFRIRNVRTTNEHVTAHVLSKEESAQRLGPDDPPDARIIEVVVSPDTPWGGLFSWLQMTVSGKRADQLAPTVHTTRIRINGQVFGALAAEPDTFRFGVPAGESFERRIRLTRRHGEPFRVLDATAEVRSLPGAQVRVEQVGDGAYELILTATAGEEVAHCRGAVIVKTDVPGEETIAIEVVGVVRRDGSG